MATSFWKTVKTVENLSENPCLKGYSIDGDKFLENCQNSRKCLGKSLPNSRNLSKSGVIKFDKICKHLQQVFLSRFTPRNAWGLPQYT
jgi:hypothetical protein